MLVKHQDPLSEVQRWSRHPFWQDDIDLAAEEAAERKKRRFHKPMINDEVYPQPEEVKESSSPKVPHTSNGDTVLSEEDWHKIHTDPAGNIERYLEMPFDLLEENLSQEFPWDPEFAIIVYAVYLRGIGEVHKSEYITHNLDQMSSASSWDAFKQRVDRLNGDY